MNQDIVEGYANALGVMAAELAALGFTGPDDVTAHFSAIVSDYEPELLVRGLGSDYLISSGGLHFKLHQTLGMTQSAADAILDALKKRAVRPGDIRQIDVLVNQRGVRIEGTMGATTERAVPNAIAAKSSIPYVVSAIVTFYDDVKRDPHFTELYTEEKLANPERQTLASKVKVSGSLEYDKNFDQDWPMKFPAKADIQLNDGGTVSGEAEIFGVSSRLTDDQLIAKFKDLAGRVLPRDHLNRAVEKVFALDKLENVDEVIRAVCI
jgi:2-methylcitrate dehydratase PrpD